eukprot:TRINITY_DN2104_c0_g3_i2.p1 TRINITY_DN2104_c0_g3~~TRINITY_DN2104_c0_g3_i2.p1  ORF type:complete len:159 (-),score=11.67 TRINITY_DN2104_c0_g3_i2:162-638(-)
MVYPGHNQESRLTFMLRVDGQSSAENAAAVYTVARGAKRTPHVREGSIAATARGPVFPKRQALPSSIGPCSTTLQPDLVEAFLRHQLLKKRREGHLGAQRDFNGAPWVVTKKVEDSVEAKWRDLKRAHVNTLPREEGQALLEALVERWRVFWADRYRI